MLLTDGTVLAQDAIHYNMWWKLTPDIPAQLYTSPGQPDPAWEPVIAWVQDYDLPPRLDVPRLGGSNRGFKLASHMTFHHTAVFKVAQRDPYPWHFAPLKRPPPASDR